MTITRLGQFTAETRVLTDITHFASAPTISSVAAKTGTYSYKLDYNVGGVGKPLSVAITEGRLGWWMMMDTLEIEDTTALCYVGGAMQDDLAANSNHIYVRISTVSGTLELRRPISNNAWETLESILLPSQFSTADSWFHVGIACKIHATTGYFSVYISGTRVLNYIGDTRPTAWVTSLTYYTDAAFWVTAGGTNSSGLNGFNNAFVDDIFLDSIVGEVDSPVPSRRFLMVLPTGAGADAAWTPLSGANYTNVDENPNDGDASYVKALSANLRDTYVMGDITLPADHRIVAVLPSPFAKRLDAEIASGLSVHAWDGATYLDSADLDLSMSYDVPAHARLETQPDLSLWDESSFNSMQFGVRSRGTF